VTGQPIHIHKQHVLGLYCPLSLNGGKSIKGSTETSIYDSKEGGGGGLELSAEKIKYMLLSRHQNVGQNLGLKIANRSFENMSQFEYFRTIVTNQNLIKEEFKTRLNSGFLACWLKT
jgi:hypothetical protein